MKTLDLITDAVAAYRLTKLVTDDVITEPIRDAVIERAYADRFVRTGAPVPNPERRVKWTELAQDDDDPPKLATLVTCRWCTGVWFGFGIVAARAICPRWWDPIARGLALAAAAALIAGLEE